MSEQTATAVSIPACDQNRFRLVRFPSWVAWIRGYDWYSIGSADDPKALRDRFPGALILKMGERPQSNRERAKT